MDGRYIGLQNRKMGLKQQNLKRLFPKINKKISFVRFACHYDEVFFLKDCIKWLSKHGVLVFINIMQVSEIDSKILKKICYFLKDKDIKALYFADSLGALNSKKIKLLKKDLKSFWSNKDVGLHAHDNLNLAFNLLLIKSIKKKVKVAAQTLLSIFSLLFVAGFISISDFGISKSLMI